MFVSCLPRYDSHRLWTGWECDYLMMNGLEERRGEVRVNRCYDGMRREEEGEGHN